MQENNPWNNLFIVWHIEIYKISELEDKDIFIFLQGKTKRGEAASLESYTEMASL